MSPRGRLWRKNGAYIGALVLGASGFLWSPGPNILMLFGAFVLFMTAMLCQVEESKYAE